MMENKPEQTPTERYKELLVQNVLLQQQKQNHGAAINPLTDAEQVNIEAKINRFVAKSDVQQAEEIRAMERINDMLRKEIQKVAGNNGLDRALNMENEGGGVHLEESRREENRPAATPLSAPAPAATGYRVQPSTTNPRRITVAEQVGTWGPQLKSRRERLPQNVVKSLFSEVQQLRAREQELAKQLADEFKNEPRAKQSLSPDDLTFFSELKIVVPHNDESQVQLNPTQLEERIASLQAEKKQREANIARLEKIQQELPTAEQLAIKFKGKDNYVVMSSVARPTVMEVQERFEEAASANQLSQSPAGSLTEAVTVASVPAAQPTSNAPVVRPRSVSVSATGVSGPKESASQIRRKKTLYETVTGYIFGSDDETVRDEKGKARATDDGETRKKTAAKSSAVAAPAEVEEGEQSLYATVTGGLGRLVTSIRGTEPTEQALEKGVRSDTKTKAKKAKSYAELKAKLDDVEKRLNRFNHFLPEDIQEVLNGEEEGFDRVLLHLTRDNPDNIGPMVQQFFDYKKALMEIHDELSELEKNKKVTDQKDAANVVQELKSLMMKSYNTERSLLNNDDAMETWRTWSLQQQAAAVVPVVPAVEIQRKKTASFSTDVAPPAVLSNEVQHVEPAAISPVVAPPREEGEQSLYATTISRLWATVTGSRKQTESSERAEDAIRQPEPQESTSLWSSFTRGVNNLWTRFRGQQDVEVESTSVIETNLRSSSTSTDRIDVLKRELAELERLMNELVAFKRTIDMHIIDRNTGNAQKFSRERAEWYRANLEIELNSRYRAFKTQLVKVQSAVNQTTKVDEKLKARLKTVFDYDVELESAEGISKTRSEAQQLKIPLAVPASERMESMGPQSQTEILLGKLRELEALQQKIKAAHEEFMRMPGLRKTTFRTEGGLKRLVVDYREQYDQMLNHIVSLFGKIPDEEKRREGVKKQLYGPNGVQMRIAKANEFRQQEIPKYIYDARLASDDPPREKNKTPLAGSGSETGRGATLPDKTAVVQSSQHLPLGTSSPAMFHATGAALRDATNISADEQRKSRRPTTPLPPIPPAGSKSKRAATVGDENRPPRDPYQASVTKAGASSVDEQRRFSIGMRPKSGDDGRGK